MPYEADRLWHGTDLASAQDIVRNGIDIDKCDRGYFGRAFYATPNKALAWSNYADWAEGDDEPGAVVEFELIDPSGTLDLRDSDDWDAYRESGLADIIHRWDLPALAARRGITGVYDRSNDALAVYDPRILRVVAIHTTNTRENPPKKARVPTVWYHGDTSKRANFNSQNMDRDRTRDPNAMGPGIYWTSDKNQAAGYAGPNGYVYTATIKTTKLLYDDKPRPDRDDIAWLIENSDDPDGGLSNWGYGDGMTTREAALRQAVDAYGEYNDSMIDAALTVSNDFYGREDANLWAYNMARMGVDAFYHKLPQVDHLIVYNPRIIKVTKEEKKGKKAPA